MRAVGRGAEVTSSVGLREAWTGEGCWWSPSPGRQLLSVRPQNDGGLFSVSQRSLQNGAGAGPMATRPSEKRLGRKRGQGEAFSWALPPRTFCSCIS